MWFTLSLLTQHYFISMELLATGYTVYPCQDDEFASLLSLPMVAGFTTVRISHSGKTAFETAEQIEKELWIWRQKRGAT